MTRAVVSVIILNWNGLKNGFIGDCISSLERQTYPDLEVIAVDNASMDDSVAFLRKRHPDVRLVENDENLGFCTANNVGYRHASGSYVLFANNDTAFAPCCIERLVRLAELHPDAGMVSPKLVRPSPSTDEHRILDSAGLFIRRDLTLRDRGYGERDYGQFDSVEYVFAPCGAAAFYRREALDSVMQQGSLPWDESFGSYYEDGDLGWRLQRAGWRCIYCPDAIVQHHRGGSSAAAFFRKPQRAKVATIRNRYLMMAKNAPVKLLLYRLPFLVAREGLIWAYLALHPRLLVEVMTTLATTLPDALHKRHNIRDAVTTECSNEEPA